MTDSRVSVVHQAKGMTPPPTTPPTTTAPRPPSSSKGGVNDDDYLVDATAAASDGAVVAAVEGGGTTFKVAVVRLTPQKLLPPPSSSYDDDTNQNSIRILHRAEYPSDIDPHACLRQCADFLRRHMPPDEGYRALGVACFGPLGLHRNTVAYGRILPSSPKAIWRNVDVLTPLVQACRRDGEDNDDDKDESSLAVMLDTDVNAPALVEYRRALQAQQQQQQQQQQNDSSGTAGSAAWLSSCAYVTVGTGVGVGLVVNGSPVHGLMHPEAGHVLVPSLLPNDSFQGYSWGRDTCPYFGVNTVEGTTSSVALVERLQHMTMMMHRGDGGAAAQLSSSTGQGRNVLATLPDDHEIWEHAVNAVASLCVTLLLTVSVERIVLGGGVVQHRPALLDQIRRRVPVLVNGYLDLPASYMSDLIVTSDYGDDAGLYGAIGLAQEALLRLRRQRRQSRDGDKEERGHGDDDDDDDDDEKKKKKKTEERRMKQVAFGHGLWHGALVGAVGTALLFAYAVIPALTRMTHRKPRG
jgi:fructokinase